MYVKMPAGKKQLKRLRRLNKKILVAAKQIDNGENGNNDDDSDNDDTNEPINPLLFPTQDNSKIYRSGNHIYFRDNITLDSISKLCKLIEEANNEFHLLQSTIKHALLIPKPLYLHITSYGGSILAGLMAADTIENSLVPIYTVAEGYVMSSGTFLSLAGKKRFMTKNAYILIHQLSSAVSGTIEHLADDQTNNEELMKRMKKIYDEKTGGKLKGKKLENILKHDIYMGFNVCLELGLVDGLYEIEQLKTCDEV